MLKFSKKGSNSRLEVLALQKLMFLLRSIFGVVVGKGSFTKRFEGWFSKSMAFTVNKLCFVTPEKRDSINRLRDQLLETSSYDNIRKKQL